MILKSKLFNKASIRRFWQKRGVLNYALLPFSLLYWLGHLCNFYILNRPKKVDAYVICVGNAIVGGSGKTPICCTIAKELSNRGHNVAIISRGYGGASSNADVIRVSEDSNYLDVGDEPLILSQYAPTYVSRSKVAAAERAIADGADLIIMDDGYQNNSIYKDFNILLLSAEYALGNGFMLPAGGLREPFWAASGRADLKVLVSYNDASAEIERAMKSLQRSHGGFATLQSGSKCAAKRLSQYLEARAQYICDMDIAGQNVITLSSISNPDVFVKTVESLGAKVQRSIIYDDHYAYSDIEIEDIIKNSNGVPIVTTEKDFVKISQKYRDNFICVKVEMKIDFSNINFL